MKMLKANSCCAPQCGNGKLTDYTKEGSWIMNQLKSGKPEPGIKVDKSGDHIRFAKIAANVVTASCEEMAICRAFKQLSSATRNDFRFALKWIFNGNLNGCTVEELNLIKELLWAKVSIDVEKLNGTFTTNMPYIGQPALDIVHSTLKVESIMEFTINIATDASVISNFLKQLGFDDVNAVVEEQI